MHIWLHGMLICTFWLPVQNEVLAEECVELGLALPAQYVPRRELLFAVPYMEKAGFPADVGQKAFIASFKKQHFLWLWDASKTSEMH